MDQIHIDFNILLENFKNVNSIDISKELTLEEIESNLKNFHNFLYKNVSEPLDIISIDIFNEIYHNNDLINQYKKSLNEMQSIIREKVVILKNKEKETLIFINQVQLLYEKLLVYINPLTNQGSLQRALQQIPFDKSDLLKKYNEFISIYNNPDNKQILPFVFRDHIGFDDELEAFIIYYEKNKNNLEPFKQTFLDNKLNILYSTINEYDINKSIDKQELKNMHDNIINQCRDIGNDNPIIKKILQNLINWSIKLDRNKFNVLIIELQNLFIKLSSFTEIDFISEENKDNVRDYNSKLIEYERISKSVGGLNIINFRKKLEDYLYNNLKKISENYVNALKNELDTKNYIDLAKQYIDKYSNNLNKDYSNLHIVKIIEGVIKEEFIKNEKFIIFQDLQIKYNKIMEKTTKLETMDYKKRTHTHFTDILSDIQNFMIELDDYQFGLLNNKENDDKIKKIQSDITITSIMLEFNFMQFKILQNNVIDPSFDVIIKVLPSKYFVNFIKNNIKLILDIFYSDQTNPTIVDSIKSTYFQKFSSLIENDESIFKDTRDKLIDYFWGKKDILFDTIFILIDPDNQDNKSNLEFIKLINRLINGTINQSSDIDNIINLFEKLKYKQIEINQSYYNELWLCYKDIIEFIRLDTILKQKKIEEKNFLSASNNTLNIINEMDQERIKVNKKRKFENIENVQQNQINEKTKDLKNKIIEIDNNNEKNKIINNKENQGIQKEIQQINNKLNEIDKEKLKISNFVYTPENLEKYTTKQKDLDDKSNKLKEEKHKDEKTIITNNKVLQYTNQKNTKDIENLEKIEKNVESQSKVINVINEITEKSSRENIILPIEEEGKPSSIEMIEENIDYKKLSEYFSYLKKIIVDFKLQKEPILTNIGKGLELKKIDNSLRQFLYLIKEYYDIIYNNINQEIEAINIYINYHKNNIPALTLYKQEYLNLKNSLNSKIIDYIDDLNNNNRIISDDDDRDFLTNSKIKFDELQLKTNKLYKEFITNLLEYGFNINSKEIFITSNINLNRIIQIEKDIIWCQMDQNYKENIDLFSKQIEQKYNEKNLSLDKYYNELENLKLPFKIFQENNDFHILSFTQKMIFLKDVIEQYSLFKENKIIYDNFNNDIVKIKNQYDSYFKSQEQSFINNVKDCIINLLKSFKDIFETFQDFPKSKLVENKGLYPLFYSKFIKFYSDFQLLYQTNQFQTIINQNDIEESNNIIYINQFIILNKSNFNNLNQNKLIYQFKSKFVKSIKKYIIDESYRILQRKYFINLIYNNIVPFVNLLYYSTQPYDIYMEVFESKTEKSDFITYSRTFTKDESKYSNTDLFLIGLFDSNNEQYLDYEIDNWNKFYIPFEIFQKKILLYTNKIDKTKLISRSFSNEYIINSSKKIEKLQKFDVFHNSVIFEEILHTFTLYNKMIDSKDETSLFTKNEELLKKSREYETVTNRNFNLFLEIKSILNEFNIISSLNMTDLVEENLQSSIFNFDKKLKEQIINYCDIQKLIFYRLIFHNQYINLQNTLKLIDELYNSIDNYNDYIDKIESLKNKQNQISKDRIKGDDEEGKIKYSNLLLRYQVIKKQSEKDIESRINLYKSALNELDNYLIKDPKFIQFIPLDIQPIITLNTDIDNFIKPYAEQDAKLKKKLKEIEIEIEKEINFTIIDKTIESIQVFVDLFLNNYNDNIIDENIKKFKSKFKSITITLNKLKNRYSTRNLTINKIKNSIKQINELLDNKLSYKEVKKEDNKLELLFKDFEYIFNDIQESLTNLEEQSNTLNITNLPKILEDLTNSCKKSSNNTQKDIEIYMNKIDDNIKNSYKLMINELKTNTKLYENKDIFGKNFTLENFSNCLIEVNSLKLIFTVISEYNDKLKTELIKLNKENDKQELLKLLNSLKSMENDSNDYLNKSQKNNIDNLILNSSERINKFKKIANWISDIQFDKSKLIDQSKNMNKKLKEVKNESNSKYNNLNLIPDNDKDVFPKTKSSYIQLLKKLEKLENNNEPLITKIDNRISEWKVNINDICIMSFDIINSIKKPSDSISNDIKKLKEDLNNLTLEIDNEIPKDKKQLDKLFEDELTLFRSLMNSYITIINNCEIYLNKYIFSVDSIVDKNSYLYIIAQPFKERINLLNSLKPTNEELDKHKGYNLSDISFYLMINIKELQGKLTEIKRDYEKLSKTTKSNKEGGGKELGVLDQELERAKLIISEYTEIKNVMNNIDNPSKLIITKELDSSNKFYDFFIKRDFKSSNIISTQLKSLKESIDDEKKNNLKIIAIQKQNNDLKLKMKDKFKEFEKESTSPLLTNVENPTKSTIEQLSSEDVAKFKNKKKLESLLKKIDDYNNKFNSNNIEIDLLIEEGLSMESKNEQQRTLITNEIKTELVNKINKNLETIISIKKALKQDILTLKKDNPIKKEEEEIKIQNILFLGAKGEEGEITQKSSKGGKEEEEEKREEIVFSYDYSKCINELDNLEILQTQLIQFLKKFNLMDIDDDVNKKDEFISNFSEKKSIEEFYKDTEEFLKNFSNITDLNELKIEELYSNGIKRLSMVKKIKQWYKQLSIKININQNYNDIILEKKEDLSSYSGIKDIKKDILSISKILYNEIEKEIQKLEELFNQILSNNIQIDLQISEFQLKFDEICDIDIKELLKISGPNQSLLNNISKLNIDYNSFKKRIENLTNKITTFKDKFDNEFNSFITKFDKKEELYQKFNKNLTTIQNEIPEGKEIYDSILYKIEILKEKIQNNLDLMTPKKEEKEKELNVENQIIRIQNIIDNEFDIVKDMDSIQKEKLSIQKESKFEEESNLIASGEFIGIFLANELVESDLTIQIETQNLIEGFLDYIDLNDIFKNMILLDIKIIYNALQESKKKMEEFKDLVISLKFSREELKFINQDYQNLLIQNQGNEIMVENETIKISSLYEKEYKSIIKKARELINKINIIIGKMKSKELDYNSSYKRLVEKFGNVFATLLTNSDKKNEEYTKDFNEFIRKMNKYEEEFKSEMNNLVENQKRKITNFVNMNYQEPYDCFKEYSEIKSIYLKIYHINPPSNLNDNLKNIQIKQNYPSFFIPYEELIKFLNEQKTFFDIFKEIPSMVKLFDELSSKTNKRIQIIKSIQGWFYELKFDESILNNEKNIDDYMNIIEGYKNELKNFMELDYIKDISKQTLLLLTSVNNFKIFRDEIVSVETKLTKFKSRLSKLDIDIESYKIPFQNLCQYDLEPLLKLREPPKRLLDNIESFNNDLIRFQATFANLNNLEKVFSSSWDNDKSIIVSKKDNMLDKIKRIRYEVGLINDSIEKEFNLINKYDKQEFISNITNIYKLIDTINNDIIKIEDVYPGFNIPQKYISFIKILISYKSDEIDSQFKDIKKEFDDLKKNYKWNIYIDSLNKIQFDINKNKIINTKTAINELDQFIIPLLSLKSIPKKFNFFQFMIKTLPIYEKYINDKSKEIEKLLVLHEKLNADKSTLKNVIPGKFNSKLIDELSEYYSLTKNQSLLVLEIIESRGKIFELYKREATIFLTQIKKNYDQLNKIKEEMTGESTEIEKVRDELNSKMNLLKFEEDQNIENFLTQDTINKIKSIPKILEILVNYDKDFEKSINEKYQKLGKKAEGIDTIKNSIEEATNISNDINTLLNKLDKVQKINSSFIVDVELLEKVEKVKAKTNTIDYNSKKKDGIMSFSTLLFNIKRILKDLDIIYRTLQYSPDAEYNKRLIIPDQRKLMNEIYLIKATFDDDFKDLRSIIDYLYNLLPKDKFKEKNIKFIKSNEEIDKLKEEEFDPSIFYIYIHPIEKLNILLPIYWIFSIQKTNEGELLFEPLIKISLHKNQMIKELKKNKINEKNTNGLFKIENLPQSIYKKDIHQNIILFIENRIQSYFYKTNLIIENKEDLIDEIFREYDYKTRPDDIYKFYMEYFDVEEPKKSPINRKYDSFEDIVPPDKEKWMRRHLKYNILKSYQQKTISRFTTRKLSIFNNLYTISENLKFEDEPTLSFFLEILVIYLSLQGRRIDLSSFSLFGIYTLSLIEYLLNLSNYFKIIINFKLFKEFEIFRITDLFYSIRAPFILNYFTLLKDEKTKINLISYPVSPTINYSNAEDEKIPFEIGPSLTNQYIKVYLNIDIRSDNFFYLLNYTKSNEENLKISKKFNIEFEKKFIVDTHLNLWIKNDEIYQPYVFDLHPKDPSTSNFENENFYYSCYVRV